MSYYDDASLVLIPSGVKASKVYSQKPTNGSGDFTFSRASAATRTNASGAIESVASNVPRLDYSGGATCPSLLLEGQRTNLVFPSNTATTQTRTVTATAHTLTFYGTGTVVLSGVATGTLTGTGANNRVALTFTPTAGSLILTVTGTVTNWQLEAGSFSSTLIQTTTAAVTRLADVAEKTGIGSLIGQAQGTLFIEGSSFNFLGVGSGERISVTDGTFNNRVNIDFSSTGAVQLVASNSTTAQNGSISTSNGAVTANNRFKIAIAYDGANSRLYVNGTAFSTIVGTIPTFSGQLTKFEFNQGNSFRPFYGRINQAALFPTRLTNDQLAELTTL